MTDTDLSTFPGIDRISHGGYVDFVDGVPIYGEGWFTIFNRPSNKH